MIFSFFSFFFAICFSSFQLCLAECLLQELFLVRPHKRLLCVAKSVYALRVARGYVCVAKNVSCDSRVV